MSPLSIVVETVRSWVRILSATAVVMAFIAAFPGEADAASRAEAQSAPAPSDAQAAASSLRPAVSAEPQPRALLTTRFVTLDISNLSQSAFGDTDDSAR